MEYNIIEKGVLKMLEMVYYNLKNGRAISARSICKSTGLDKRHWAELIKQGIVVKPRMEGGVGFYIWNGITPNIKMAKELLYRIPISYDKDSEMWYSAHMLLPPEMEIKEKRRAVVKEEPKELNVPFEDFWNAYEKKVGLKNKVEAAWRKLTNKEREAAMAYIPKYKEAQPEKMYRKDPIGFIHSKKWEDEIIKTAKPQPETNRPISDIEIYNRYKFYHDELIRRGYERNEQGQFVKKLG